MRSPEAFVAAYGGHGASIVLYKIEADGTLNGVWTVEGQKGVGTDILTPERFTSAGDSDQSTKPVGPAQSNPAGPEPSPKPVGHAVHAHHSESTETNAKESRTKAGATDQEAQKMPTALRRKPNQTAPRSHTTQTAHRSRPEPMEQRS